MPLPDFLIIGAQKSGTTWLLDRLREHPEVFLPPKEIHFFDKAHNFARGAEWYRQFFAEASGAKAIGEKTPDYFWTGTAGAEGHLPDVHRNIHDLLPEVRLILVLRNPVERAISAVNHIIRTGRVSPRLTVDSLLVGDRRHLVEPHGVIDYGRYMKHIRAYLEYFDRRQLQLLIFEEDVVADPARGLEKVADFLEVDASFPFTGLRVKSNAPPVSKVGLHARYHLPALAPLVNVADRLLGSREFKLRPREETLQELYVLYGEDNQRLFEFLGRKIDAWTSSGSDDPVPIGQPEG